jgi:hypothetical protein
LPNRGGGVCCVVPVLAHELGAEEEVVPWEVEEDCSEDFGEGECALLGGGVRHVWVGGGQG